ncbi:DNA repair protein RecN [Bifidobacterium simiarum]|uniref:DNA repair protein RecN n=1 Tax=Bifidobacterium simiarum TaxID=2045441 RepID=A0A2M9HHA7_9BIFI|nr:DNA repair protein RecN [Bifidobacterium simiarum]PJM76179.1 DNA repair protein RecN [Bifidobacterium simiarum]
MLRELEIRNLGPIRHAMIAPATGMTAITGETGAGKSMLLNALRLISGGDAPGRMVSAGAHDAWAQGVFDVGADDGASRMASEAGTDVEDGELYLTRSVPSKGRSRAVLNGRSVPRAVLQRISGELVTIHGQSDQLRMAAASRQRGFLDSYAGDGALAEAYHEAWRRLNDCDAKLRGLSEQQAETRQRADYLRESIERIDAVAPKAGEDDELHRLRDRIENAAQIARGVSEALAAIDPSQIGVDDDMSSGGSPGASALVEQAAQSLRSIRVEGDYADLADRLESVNAELSDVVYALTGLIDDDAQGQDLDQINGRIHDLDELSRRWGPTLDDVLAWREKAGYELEDLDDSPERLERLRSERSQAWAVAMKAAWRLHEARAGAARDLAGRVTGELKSLAMNGAALDIEVTARAGAGAATEAESADGGAVGGWEPSEAPADGFGPLDASGCDDVRFLFTPFPGSPRLPMGKSASGGELSRLMLALELAAADRGFGAGAGAGKDAVGSSPSTFVFDEVDAGVGGKAAAELGRRLATLARNAQVVVVTHLPQVASWADAQFVVSKGAARTEEAASTGDDAPAGDGSDADVWTTVSEVRGEEREREIARMLAGSESETSISHARELLDSSRL